MADDLDFRERQKERQKELTGTGAGEITPQRGDVGDVPLTPTRSAFQQASVTTPVLAGGATTDVTGGGMSAAFAAKYQEALAQEQIQIGQPIVREGIRLTETGSITEDFKQWWAAQTTPEGETHITPGGIEKAISAFVTASTISLIVYYGLGLLGIGKVAATTKGLAVTQKSTALYRSTGQLMASPATTTSILSAAWKSGYVKTGLLLYALKEAQQDIVHGKFQLVEGLDKLGYARTRLIQLGLDETAIGIEVQQSIDQYTEAMNWFRMNVPILGSKIGTDKNIKAAEIAKRAWDAVAAEEKRRLKTGDDFAASAKNLKQEMIDMEKTWMLEQTAYYAEIEKNAAAAKAAARAEEEAYWNKILADKAARIKAEREELEAYWAEVRKKQAQWEEENRRSNLAFGLLGR